MCDKSTGKRERAAVMLWYGPLSLVFKFSALFNDKLARRTSITCRNDMFFVRPSIENGPYVYRISLDSPCRWDIS